MLDNAGNVLSNARRLNLTSNTQTFTDWVGSSDLNDFYRFTVSSRSSFNLTLNGLTANADVQIIRDINSNFLIDGTSEIINGSYVLGTASESIRATLEAGDYYIRIYPGSNSLSWLSSSSTKYSLNVSAQSVNAAPSALQFGLQNSSIRTGDTLSTINGWVFDSDGANDIARIDFRVVHNNGTFIDVADITSVNPSINENHWGRFDYNLSLAGLNLTTGNYTLRAIAYDKAGATSNVVEQRFSFTQLPVNTVPTSLQFQINKTAYNNTETISISNGSVFDANGASDISTIDFQIRRSNGTFIDVANVSNFSISNSDNRLANFNYNLSLSNLNLATDDYSLWAVAYDKAGARSSVFERQFTVLNQPVTPPKADWTFFVYMAGDNLEDFGIEDFVEMSAVGSSQNVNIVVQFDRTSKQNVSDPDWQDDTSHGNWTDTRRGIVRRGDTPDLNWSTSIGEVNMGDTNTLRNFLTWGTTNYQANNYALVLWGHGNGASASYDDINQDGITSNELSSVLAGLSSRMSLVAADSCLMGMTEYAYGIRNQASVFVGSQELVPGTGFNYTKVLSDLTASSKIGARDLGSIIVNRYAQEYRNVTYFDTTLSAINLESISTLSNRLSNFASTFMSSSTSLDRSRLETHSYYSANFGEGYFSEYCDLGILLSRIASDNSMSLALRVAAESALGTYNTAIINNFSAVNGRATGLCIYLQERGYGAWNYNNSYQAFTSDTNWDEFLSWWKNA
ncbi:clostripain-related cysteine peptidase [Dulcicalothrix desertica]|uniref:clostripain-related cysteine peptidase n=1 Tax=Dulcicalothrix desertica TaxID=32056 RepID=UPI00119AAD88|nr:clostripain-related cysteine peptidase [Dulcicalothrix desertica]TWH43358.1 clostripain [Dulcicalothrix desertica PCC 7102]